MPKSSNMIDREYTLVLQKLIETTITNLNLKRNSLLAQVEENQKARFDMTHKKASELVIVYLGDGYFVEKSAHDACKHIERKIERINQSITEFNSKINEAYETRDQLADFHNQDTYVSNADNQKNVNEEGLPFVEIEEELDEDDRIIDLKVNKTYSPDLNNGPHEELEGQQPSQILPNSTVEYDSTKITGTTNEIVASERGMDEIQFTELLEDMEIISPKKRMAAQFDQDALLEKLDKLKVSPDDKFKLKQMCIEEFKRLQEDSSNNNGKAFKNVDSTGNRNNVTNEMSENSLDEVTGNERQEVLANIIKENNLFDGKEISSTSTPKRDTQIGKDDILELELLADDFDDTETYGAGYADDEEWDFEFSENEEEYEDQEIDVADKLLYGKNDSFLGSGGNETGSKMLWEQVMNLRLNNNNEVKNSKSILKENRDKKANIKSVKFSDTLEIREIENISELLKVAETPTKISRFKQEALARNLPKVGKEHPRYTKYQISDDIGSMHLPGKADYVNGSVMIDLKQEAKPSGVELIDRQKWISESISEHEDSPKKQVAKISKFKSKMLQNGNEKSKHYASQHSDEGTPVLENEEITFNVDENDQHNIYGDVVEKDVDKIFSGLDSVVAKPNSIPSVNGGNIEEPVVDYDRDSTKQDNHHHERGFTSDSVSKDISRFNSSFIPDSSTSDSENKGVVDRIGSYTNSDVVGEVAVPIASMATNVEPEESEIRETTLDYRSMQDDLDTMAKAYILGMYDDDIATEGPVVEKLSDFENLNRLVESMPLKRDVGNSSPTAFTETSDAFDPEIDEIRRQESEDDSDDGPLLSTEIIENDNFDEGDVMNIEENILNQQLTSTYHRLRQKIIFESNELGFRMTDEELEFEPVDAGGDNKKMSRFKAARMKHA